MIGRSIGVVTDGAAGHLPADFINPLFAVSLNRKLRNLYNGPYFQYRQSSGAIKDYPAEEPDFSEDVYLVKMYDQKEKYGVPKVDFSQSIESLQPKLIKENNFFRTVFNGAEFLEPTSEFLSNVGDEFFILFVGKDDFPRPGLGLWGPEQSITVEPSTEAIGKFTVNRNRGGMSRTEDNVYGCFYGLDHSQNKNRVMSVNETGHNVKSETIDNIQNIGIGRSQERYYNGEVLEVVMHLGDLKQKWGNLITTETKSIYRNYE